MAVRRLKGETGQVMVEFALLGTALGVALFFPFVQGRSVAELLWYALVSVFRTQSLLISIM